MEEQAVFGFTGRINILHREKGEYLGAVLLKGGTVVNSSFRGHHGRKTLYRILIDDVENQILRFVVEPEIVSSGDSVFFIAIEEFKKEAQKFYQSYLESKKLKPPESIRVLLNGDFIVRGSEVTGVEFDVMEVITEFNKVRDIYESLDYMDYEITNALVRLRKAGALRVLG